MKKMPALLTGLLVGWGTSFFSYAHVGEHTSFSFVDGFMHTLTGLDHFIALILIGVFASSYRKNKSYLFVGFICLSLLFGFILGTYWSGAAGAETFVGMSMVAIPVCLMTYRATGIIRFAAILSLAIFAVCHGLVQGVEAHGTLMEYGFGTMVASFIFIVSTMMVVDFLKIVLKAAWIAKSEY